MADLITVLDEVNAEYEEKRSKFIATVRHCETEEEALRFVEEMRSKYWDARHNCYAFCVENGRLARFSDDGEPHSTAGKPMLEVIANSGITNVAVVVTRYFGGVLLGTGGLVRAYTTAVKSALLSAQLYKMVECTVLETVCDYSSLKALEYLIENNHGNIIDTEFAENVTVTYSFNSELVEAFSSVLCEAFSSKIACEIKEVKILPQKTENFLK